jgi:hypothetical protein
VSFSRLRAFAVVFASLSASAIFVAGCGGKSSGNTTAGDNLPAGSNVMPVTVDGSLCGGSAYANEPCGTVTVCQPGTSNCQTINNILIDTGSSGLRIFSSVLTVPLTPVGQEAECVGFGDGSSMWGQVEVADVKLASEPAVRVAIQVVNSTFSSPPAACTASQSTPETDPGTAGFNGILGVGLFDEDCGAGCTTNANNGIYYSCTGASCFKSVATTQVRNPVALLPSDNNGVVMQLPAVPDGGVASLNGALLLGIGTQSNNAPAGVQVYAADPSQGTFTTVFAAFSGTAIPGLIDSGSSQLFIPTIAALPDCNTAGGGSHGTSWAGLFCPSSEQSLSATNQGFTGGSAAVHFSVANAFTQLNSSSNVFSNVAGSSGTTPANATFDWGIPFFYGRTVYVGLENKSSPIASGVYWAY